MSQLSLFNFSFGFRVSGFGFCVSGDEFLDSLIDRLAFRLSVLRFNPNHIPLKINVSKSVFVPVLPF